MKEQKQKRNINIMIKIILRQIFEFLDNSVLDSIQISICMLFKDIIFLHS